METYFTPVPPGFISAAELAPFIKGSSNDWSHLLPQEEITFPPELEAKIAAARAIKDNEGAAWIATMDRERKRRGEEWWTENSHRLEDVLEEENQNAEEKQRQLEERRKRNAEKKKIIVKDMKDLMFESDDDEDSDDAEDIMYDSEEELESSTVPQKIKKKNAVESENPDKNELLAPRHMISTGVREIHGMEGRGSELRLVSGIAPAGLLVRRKAPYQRSSDTLVVSMLFIFAPLVIIGFIRRHMKQQR